MMKQLFRQVLCSLFRNVFLMIAKLFSKSCFYTKISYRKELHTVAPWFQHIVCSVKSDWNSGNEQSLLIYFDVNRVYLYSILIAHKFNNYWAKH